MSIFIILWLTLVAQSSFADNEYKIAFGSCLRQNEPAPILQTIVDTHPNVFVFMGDNIYADTTDMQEMRRQYSKLTTRPEFQQLKRRSRILATWDDHDYGRNDSGSDYPARDESSRIFLETFEVDKSSPRWSRPGIYGVEYVGTQDQRIQILLLDTRYFRSALQEKFITPSCPRRNLVPNYSAGATILGDAQWTWLQQQLQAPARLRIIVSSIQVIPDQHCYEKWANFPLERDRFFQLLKDSKANGVILASGDRHFAEISKLDDERAPYPVYEITSSSFNASGAGSGEQNSYRITGDNFREDNFGMISVDWEQNDPLITMQLRDVKGRVAMERKIRLSVISN